jgi:hypothetical protein
MTGTAQAKSKTNWQKASVHEDVTLPSGFVVDIKLPNLAALIKSGALPNDLIEVASAAAAAGEVPPELFEKLDEFNRFLVAKTVVKPEIAEEEVNSLPTEDIDMLVGFATRTRDMDAIGHHIAGLEKIDSFRKFRGLESSPTGVLGL